MSILLGTNIIAAEVSAQIEPIDATEPMPTHVDATHEAHITVDTRHAYDRYTCAPSKTYSLCRS